MKATHPILARGSIAVTTAALLFTVVACSDDTSDVPDGSGDADPSGTTEGPGGDEDENTEPGAGTDTSDAIGIAEALQQLPDDAEWRMVSIGDLSAAAEAIGLEVSEDDLTWRSAVVSGLPLQDIGSVPDEELEYAPAIIALPQLLDRAYLTSEMTDVAEVTGWSPFDVTSVAALTGGSTGLEEFVVVTGDFPEDALAGTLTDLGDGVWTLGEEDDMWSDPNGESRVLDTLGRPIRMAQEGDTIAIALRTELVRDWASGDQALTAADRPELADPAAALDEVGVLSAQFFTPMQYNPIGGGLSPTTSPEDIIDFDEDWRDQLIGPALGSITLGFSVQDDEPTVTMVYHFNTASAADQAAPLIESLLAGDTFDGQREISTVITVESVEAQDNLVVVTGTQPPATTWSRLHSMIINGEPPFVTR